MLESMQYFATVIPDSEEVRAEQIMWLGKDKIEDQVLKLKRLFSRNVLTKWNDLRLVMFCFNTTFIVYLLYNKLYLQQDLKLFENV